MWDFAAKRARWLQGSLGQRYACTDLVGVIPGRTLACSQWLCLCSHACLGIRGTMTPWTMNVGSRRSKLPYPWQGILQLQFGRGRRWSGGRSKQTAEQAFIPWFWKQYFLKCSISLEIRIKTILITSILESKAPSKAHWGGVRDSRCAWDSAHSACCFPDLLETSSHSQGIPSKEQTKLRLLPLEIRFQDN